MNVVFLVAMTVAIAGMALMAPVELPPDQFVVAYIPPADAGRAALELDLLHHVLNSRIRSTGEVCFVALGKSQNGDWLDPPAGFIERFGDRGRFLQPVSKARLPRADEMESSIRWRGVEDPATGSRTSVYYAVVIQWIDATTAKVNAGTYGGPLSGGGVSGAIYRREGATWVQISEGSQWIGSKRGRPIQRTEGILT